MIYHWKSGGVVGGDISTLDTFVSYLKPAISAVTDTETFQTDGAFREDRAILFISAKGVSYGSLLKFAI